MILKIEDDFSLDKIISCGQCFRAEEYGDSCFRFIHRDHIMSIRQISTDIFETDADESAWNSVWHRYFDLDRNYSAVRRIIASCDSFMLKASEEGAGIRILKQDPWEMLITFIISQRKSIPAIRQSVCLMAERWGTPAENGKVTLHCFPTPAQLSSATDAELKDCKLGYRVSYVQDAIGRVCSGETDLEALYECSYEHVMSELLKIRGVGEKVANCIALFAYGQTSAAPVDTWIRKIIDKEYRGYNPFDQYGDNAGIMQQYAFWYAQNHKEEF